MSRIVKSIAFTAGTLVSTAALAASTYDEARVLSAEPVYESVSYEVPREQCRNEEVAYHEPGHARRSVTPTILGAVIGGALGNAVGHKKRNRQVGTVVGAVLGGSIATDLSRRHRQAQAGDVVRYRTERVCQVVNEVRYEEELVGYDVRYRYAGGVYHTRMPHHPGDTLRVKVRVQPAE
jgi:uncharacterized protein YcfJ